MTRAELIRKIAKQSGVPDSESRIFFEIFLKRLTAILKIGQALNVRDFGFFYLLQGKIIRPESNLDEGKFQAEFIDLIYHSTSELPDLKNLDGLFFNVPVLDEDEFNSVDAAFSLSFGKPLIPFTGYTGTDFYIPHTGSELRRLIESKVDKNIENSEIISELESLKSVIEIDSDIFNKSAFLPDATELEQREFGKATSEEQPFVTKISEKDLIDSDWSKDLNKQIEEDAILDLDDSDTGDKNNSETRPVLTWDFGSFDEIEESTEDEKTDSEAEITDVKDEQPWIDIEYDKDDVKPGMQPESEKEDQSKKPELKEKFERVKTLSKIIDEKISKETTPFIPDADKNKSGKTVYKKPIIKRKDDFLEIKPPVAKVNRKPEKDIPVVRKEKTTPQRKSNEQFLLENEKEKFRKRRQQSQSSFMPYLMLIFSILIIAYGIYYYINNIKGVSEKKVQEQVIRFNTDRMTIIDRDFDFPVSYPYPKRTEGILNKLNIFESGTGKTDEELLTGDSAIQSSEKKKESVVEQVKVNNEAPEGNITRLGTNLFKYGNVYIVQVAAFRSSSVAENEAGRFRNKGYNAFVERAEVEGSIWHRVKVGNFTDLREAEKFAVQFK
jgi:nucleoid DNA-binding protein